MVVIGIYGEFGSHLRRYWMALERIVAVMNLLASFSFLYQSVMALWH